MNWSIRWLVCGGMTQVLPWQPREADTRPHQKYLPGRVSGNPGRSDGNQHIELHLQSNRPARGVEAAMGFMPQVVHKTQVSQDVYFFLFAAFDLFPLAQEYGLTRNRLFTQPGWRYTSPGNNASQAPLGKRQTPSRLPPPTNPFRGGVADDKPADHQRNRSTPTQPDFFTS